MPRVKHEHLQEYQRRAGLTDRQVAESVGKSTDWWRGYKADLFATSWEVALILKRVLRCRMADLRYRKPESRPTRAEVTT
jgi:hypothetical protein